MSGDLQVITDPILNLHVTSSVTSFGSERRYPKDLTISALKVSDIMYTWTGFFKCHVFLMSVAKTHTISK